jgi:uncharacterized protein
MPMIPARANLGIAIDGGGSKGLIVAQALLALEKELTDDKPLIEYPGLKMLVGTSTGTVITAGIALGMRVKDIVELYDSFGEKVFHPLVPRWLPSGLRTILTMLVGLTRPSLYPANQMKAVIRDYIQRFTGNADLTLGELRKRLRPDQALIITVMDIAQRRTRFLKSYQQSDSDWMLWEAILATVSAPAVLPVVQRNGVYYCDGGIGSYGNPAYIAAREAVDWAKYQPKDVSIFSFGTGWLSENDYLAFHGKPTRWNLLKWALTAPYISVEDNARTQSLDIIDDFMDLEDRNKGMDFRRFQTLIARDFDTFAPAKVTNAQMRQYGDKMGMQIVNNQHALGEEDGYDPEGLRSVLDCYKTSQAVGGAPQTPQGTHG